MKINNINNIEGIKKYQQLNQRDKEIKKSGLQKDKISISDEAKAMLEQTKESDNSNKVAQIKEQINNGTYQVDSNKVAEKLLGFLKNI